MANNDKREEQVPITLEKLGTQYSNAITEWINKDIPSIGFKIPEGYNWQNEVSSAMLHIAQNVKDNNKQPALSVCSRDSVMTALKDMVINGLEFSRNQCYFIVLDGKLKLWTSYYGEVSVLGKLLPNLRVNANVIHLGETYEIHQDEVNGYHYIANHQVTLETLDNPIIGAYGSLVDKETGKRIYGLIMSKKEIDKSWSKAKTHNVQDDFPQEMAKRTLIRRMIKLYLNTAKKNVNPVELASYKRIVASEYTDDNLQNVTPPENESEKRKMLNSKSTGAAGLKAILEAESKNSPQNASEEPEHEITHSEPENASEKQKLTSQTKLGREPSVKINENGEIVPNETEEDGQSADLFDFDSLPF